VTRDPLTTDAAPPALATPALAPGSIVAGRYRIETRLGAGGGGTVWRCTDQKLDAVVALKIVSADGDLERWRREVAMARKIADRNVCRVHDLGETDDLRFVTMELVEGTSLRSWIRPDLPAAEARALFVQIVSGVMAIHAAGVVHRDLKPENIVVATDGRAVIVDFGLAREPRSPSSPSPRAGEAHAAADAVTRVVRGGAPPSAPAQATVTGIGTVVGTPRYMSPEQAAGDTVDARTDIWALGLIGHELLTGTLPEPDAGGRRIADAVNTAWPGGAAILRRCLAMMPDERFGDARALQAALTRRKRRWPWLVAGAAAIAAAVVVVVAQAGPPPAPQPAPVAFSLRQLTTTSTRDWPKEAPLSVAISPDAKRFAYTTGGGKLYVRDVDGGPNVAWTIPKYVEPSTKLDVAPRTRELVTSSVVGWFGDGSLGLLGATEDDGNHLYRLRANGTYELLYSHRRRMRATVSPSQDRIAIVDDEALSVLRPGVASPQVIATLGRGDTAIALAWSPDGTQLAWVRLPAQGEDAVIETMSETGTQLVEVWRARTLVFGEPLLAWVTSRRLAFSYQDPDTRTTHLLGIDTITKDHDSRKQWDDAHLGSGGAAGGTVLLLKGTASHAVQIRSEYGARVVRAHPDTTQASRIAGWTDDGRVVFLEGPPANGRIVAASPGSRQAPWTTQPWPGTTGADIPDSVVGDSVLVHRVDPQDARRVVVERISPAGSRTRLAQIDHDETILTPVRCAGDRRAPCVLEQVHDGHVTWTELDPITGTLGKLLHRRPVRERLMRGAALSFDGALLALVDGGHELTLVDRATGELLPRPPAVEAGAMLQSVGFEENGDLWATALGLHGRLFGLAQIRSKGDRKYSASIGAVADDSLRWFWRPTPLGTNADLKLAVTVRDLRLEIWRADGI
jgi:serine/threonine-protein kinase